MLAYKLICCQSYQGLLKVRQLHTFFCCNMLRFEILGHAQGMDFLYFYTGHCFRDGNICYSVCCAHLQAK